MNELTAQFLERRGFATFADYRSFDDDTHAPLTSIDAACQLLRAAQVASVPVLVMPDFDCDGVMSGTLLVAGLSELGFMVMVMTQQTDVGYGITPELAMQAMSRYPMAGLVVTSDTGINDNDGIATLRSYGRHVLVTDHHVEEMPRCAADVIVNPCATDSTYENKSICGAYVAWQVLARYAELYGNDWQRAQIERLRVFAAIGTMSDSMSLARENRRLVRDGVDIVRYLQNGGAFSGMSPWFSSSFAGLGTLVRMIGSTKRSWSIDEETFSFYVAPTINSIKRLRNDTALAYDLMFGSDHQAAATRLIKDNDHRKQVIHDIKQDILDADQPYAPFAYVTELSGVGGLLGPIASSFCSETGLPTLVLSTDGRSYRGSGRAPAGIDARSVVNDVGGWASGHAQAFGCGIDSAASLEAICLTFANMISEVRVVSPIEACDFVIGLDQAYDQALLREFVMDLDTLHPFGPGFPKPSIGCVIEPGWDLRTLSGGRHLKCRTPYGLDVLVWGAGDQMSTVETNGGIAIGTLSLNRWHGHETLQVAGDALLSRS